MIRFMSSLEGYPTHLGATMCALQSVEHSEKDSKVDRSGIRLRATPFTLIRDPLCPSPRDRGEGGSPPGPIWGGTDPYPRTSPVPVERGERVD